PGFLLTTGRFVRPGLPGLVRPGSSLRVALLAPALFLVLHGGILILGAAALPIGRVARRIVALLGVGRVIGGLWISLSFGSRCFLIRLGLGLARRALVVGSLAVLRVGPVRLVLALAVCAARRRLVARRVLSLTSLALRAGSRLRGVASSRISRVALRLRRCPGGVACWAGGVLHRVLLRGVLAASVAILVGSAILRLLRAVAWIGLLGVGRVVGLRRLRVALAGVGV